MSYTADIGATVEINAAIDDTAVAPEEDADPAEVKLEARNGYDDFCGCKKRKNQVGEPSTPDNTKTYMVEVYRENLPPSDDASLATVGGSDVRLLR